jgi:hypothetical protein
MGEDGQPPCPVCGATDHGNCEEENEDMASKDDFEKNRFMAFGRGYNDMTEAEVAADVIRRRDAARKVIEKHKKGGK